MRRLILLPALALAVTLASTTRLPAPPLPPATGTTGHAINRHLPDDTDFLMIVNVKEITKSNFFTKDARADLEKLLARPEVKPYLQEAGIDLLKDIDQVIIALGRSGFPARAVGGSRDEGPVVLFQGKFDKAKLDGQLARLAKEGKGVKAVEHNKAKFYRLTMGGPREDGPFVAVLDKSNVLVCGTKDQVVEQMNRISNKSQVKLKYPAIRDFLKARAKSPNSVDVIGLESMTMGVSATGKAGPGGAVDETVTYHTLGDEGYKSFTVAVKIKDDARGVVRLDVKKAEDLDAKRKAGEKLLAEMKEALNNAPPGIGIDAAQLAKIRELVNGIKLKTDKGAVVYEGAATGEQFATLVKVYVGLIERF